MVLHPMYLHVDEPGRAIGFEVNLQASSLLEHLRVIQFVAKKFGGERGAISQRVRDEHHPFGTTAVRFPAATFEAATAFCRDNIMDNGSPTPAFHHELEHAKLSDEVDKDLFWEMKAEPNNPWRPKEA